MEIGGASYLLELPLRADVAVIKAWKADTSGNLVYRRCARNFNPAMAMAADLVIAQVEEVVPVGCLDPDEIMTRAPASIDCKAVRRAGQWKEEHLSQAGPPAFSVTAIWLIWA
jgi:acyl CoA:acetate/3-ketoacid CoA transferase